LKRKGQKDGKVDPPRRDEALGAALRVEKSKWSDRDPKAAGPLRHRDGRPHTRLLKTPGKKENQEKRRRHRLKLAARERFPRVILSTGLGGGGSR